MPDNLFDNFVGGKLNDHEAPVPDGLWDKLTERQFDGFIGEKLKDHEAPVPEGLWDKIADAQLDNFFGTTLANYSAPVPEGAWGKVADGNVDQFFGDKLADHMAPVPAGVWEKVTDGQFDQFFGDKLGNYSAPVPDGLWEKIHPEEKDRKVVFWWRLPVAASLIFLVLLGGAMGAYFWLKQDKKADTNSVVATPTSSINNGVTDKKENNAVPQVIAPVEPGAANKIVSPGSTLPPVNGSTGNSTDASGTPALSNTTVTNQKNRKGRGDIFSNGHNTPFIPSANSKDLAAQQDLPPAVNSNNGDVPGKISDGTDLVSNNIPFTLFSPAHIVRTGLNGIQLNSHEELFDNHHASQFKSNVICPTNRGGINSDWLLELYASPDLAFRSVSTTAASSPQYMQKKDSSESMNLGFTAGIRLVKPITDNIWLKTGVQYTQMNERYIYRSENEIKTTTVVTVRTIIRAPGDTVIVSDTSVLQTAGYKNLSVTNRYRSIDIPLTIGYQFGHEGDDIKVGINAGVIVNLSSWYQGVILDSSLAVVPLTKSNMVYKSKLGLGLYAGLSISKQLGEDMQVFFEPYFRYNLSNMTTAEAAYKQKFSLGGLSIGLRFNLNRK